MDILVWPAEFYDVVGQIFYYWSYVQQVLWFLTSFYALTFNVFLVPTLKEESQSKFLPTKFID